MRALSSALYMIGFGAGAIMAITLILIAYSGGGEDLGGLAVFLAVVFFVVPLVGFVLLSGFTRAIKHVRQSAREKGRLGKEFDLGTWVFHAGIAIVIVSVGHNAIALADLLSKFGGGFGLIGRLAMMAGLVTNAIPGIVVMCIGAVISRYSPPRVVV